MRKLLQITPTPERWFRQRGLVSLLQGTGEESGAGVRGAPVLVALFLIAMLWAVPDLLDVPWVVGLLVSAATIVVTWVVANLVRRRPPFAKVARVGWWEAMAFVVVPTVVVYLAPRADLIDEETGLDAESFRLFATFVMFFVQVLLLAIVVILLTSGTGSLISLLARELVGALPRPAKRCPR